MAAILEFGHRRQNVQLAVVLPAQNGFSMTIAIQNHQFRREVGGEKGVLLAPSLYYMIVTSIIVTKIK